MENETIKQFDDKKVDLLIGAFQSMAKAVANSFGLTIDFGRSKWSRDSVEMKLTFRTRVVAADGSATGEPSDFRRNAARLKLPVDCWGKTFTASSNGQMHSYTIKDIKPRNRKYPVICLRNDNSSRKCPVSFVTSNLSS